MKSPPTTLRLAAQLRSMLASLPPARGLLPLLLLLLLWQLIQVRHPIFRARRNGGRPRRACSTASAFSPPSARPP
jgi:hypothetical protein